MNATNALRRFGRHRCNGSRRTLACLALVASLLAGTDAMATGQPGPDTPASTADARLNAFFEQAWQRDLARSPIRQSRLGQRAQQDRWDRLDPERDQEDARRVEEDLRRLATFDPAQLGPQARLSHRMFGFLAQARQHDLRWRGHEYLLTQMGGLHTQVPLTLINFHPLGNRADMDAYLQRLQAVDALMMQVVDELRRREAQGIRPPKFVYALVKDAAANQLKGAPFDTGNGDSPLYADFKRKLDALGLTAAERSDWVARAEAALRGGFLRGYRRLLAHLDEAAAQADETDGVWKLPDGDAYYRNRIEHYTTLPLDPDQVHALGLREVSRIHAEIGDIMRQVQFKGDLADFFDFVRTDPRFFHSDDAAGRQAYLDEAQALLDDMEARQHALFKQPPQTEVVIRAVEPWREASAAKAFYHSPTPGSGDPGVFYINLYDMGAAPRYQLAAILYHEAVPGHHTETMVAHQLEGLPAFRRFASIAAFSEGWGLYSEALPKEMGLYQDPYQDFGRLSMALMRAARLVVDTGLHAKRWTRAQAIAYMDANTPASHYDNQREVERYIVIPGQATAYYIGMLKLRELRERAERALGASFDLREFHARVLNDGPLPLPLLEERIEAWITAPRQTDLQYVHAARLLADPADGQVRERQTLVLRDGRIVAIQDGFTGTAGSTLDLSNHFVMPGLIDSHVHLGHENGPDDKLLRTTRTAADLAVNSAHFAYRTLLAGFTTVADLGAENDAIFAVRDGIAAGKLPGPRILAAGNVISPHGGEGDLFGYRPDVLKVLQRPNLCSGADDCRRVVRQQLQRGADLIKIVATGAVLSDADAGVDQQFTDEELRAIVETTHAHGRKVTGHAHGARGVNAFLRAGGDAIEHGTYLDPASIALFKAGNAYLVPTLLAGSTVAEWARAPGSFLSPAARSKAAQVGPAMLDMARRAHAAGVRIAFGTDSGVSRHGDNAREFSLLVQAGLSPLQAIRTATVNAAEHLGLSDQIGTLAPGKAADLIAVRGDPTRDVSVLERVAVVMKAGKTYSPETPR